MQRKPLPRKTPSLISSANDVSSRRSPSLSSAYCATDSTSSSPPPSTVLYRYTHNPYAARVTPLPPVLDGAPPCGGHCGQSHDARYPWCAASSMSDSQQDDSDTIRSSLDSPRRHPASKCDLKVCNLPREYNDALLRQMFETFFGPVVSAVVIVDDKGKSKGYGYVLMSRENDAAFAIQTMKAGALQICGRIVRASLAVKCCSSIPNPQQPASDIPSQAFGRAVSYRMPLPPIIDYTKTVNDGVDQSHAVAQILASVREHSRMKLPLPKKKTRRYFHLFINSVDAPPQLSAIFSSLTPRNKIRIFDALGE